MTATLPPPTQEDLSTAAQFHKPRTSGLGKLGMGASLMVIVACITGVIMLFVAGVIPTLVFAAVVMVFVGAASYRNHHDETILARALVRIRWKSADRRGETELASGPLSRFGVFTLPGVLAKTSLTEWKDNLGRIFQLLHYQVHNMFSVTIECEPDGSSLHDKADLDAATNRWKLWIDMAAHEPNLAQLQITVQTSPDAGQTLRREIDTHRSPTAPALAVAAMEEVKNTYPKAAALVESFVSLTYAGNRRKPEEVAKYLEARLPTLTSMLEHTGAGPSEPVTAQRLTHVVKCAFTQEYTKILADAETAGLDPETMVLRWDNAGPHVGHDGYEVYRTDDAYHISWYKTGLLSDLTADTLNPLLESHKDIHSKRVSFLFWPHNPAKAADRAGKDRANARKRVKNSKDPSAESENALQAASQIAYEHSHGSALVDWAMVITATVLDEAKIPAALAAMDSLAPSARIRHNKARGTMAFAMAQGLPVGLVAKNYDYLSQSIREGM